MNRPNKDNLKEQYDGNHDPLKNLILLARRMRQSCEPIEKISSVTGLSKEILSKNGVI